MEIRNVTHVQNIRYDRETESLWIIDQTLLPNTEREIRLATAEEMYEAIRLLQVRGAPAIGICAGYCMYALAREIPGEGDAFYEELNKAGAYLNSSRPTAVNLSWAIGKQLEVAKAHLPEGREAVLDALMPSYIAGFIYSALVDSFCAEQNARMTAMDAANRNAEELLSQLSLEYNRVRQSAITQEITEISAGAEAQRRGRKEGL